MTPQAWSLMRSIRRELAKGCPSGGMQLTLANAARLQATFEIMAGELEALRAGTAFDYVAWRKEVRLVEDA